MKAPVEVVTQINYPRQTWKYDSRFEQLPERMKGEFDAEYARKKSRDRGIGLLMFLVLGGCAWYWIGVGICHLLFHK